MSTGNNPSGRKPRQHVILTNTERQAIRQKHREARNLTQKQLAAWATDAFGRSVGQTTISECLKNKYAFLDFPQTFDPRHAEAEQIPLKPPFYAHPRTRYCPHGLSDCRCTSPGSSPEQQEYEYFNDPSSWQLPPLHASAYQETDSNKAKESYSERAKAHPPRMAVVMRSSPLPQQMDVSQIWFSGLLDDLSARVPSHKGSHHTHVDMLSTWFSHLNRVIGKSSVLDEALRSVVLHHIGLTMDDESATQTARSTYGKALRKLQRSISTPKAVVAPELATATIVLSLYEVCTANDNGGWQSHTRGAARMMNLIDSSSFSDDLGLLFIRTFAGQWIAAAFSTRDLRFVTTPLFQKAMDSEQFGHYGHDNCEFGDWVKLMYAGYITVIEIARRCYLAKSPEEVAQYAEELKVIQDQGQAAFEQLTALSPPIEVPSKFDDVVYPMVHRFTSLCHCSTYISFRVAIVGIAMFIKMLEPTNDDLDVFMESHIDGICMSVDFAMESGFVAALSLAQSMNGLTKSNLPEKSRWVHEHAGMEWPGEQAFDRLFRGLRALDLRIMRGLRTLGTPLSTPSYGSPGSGSNVSW